MIGGLLKILTDNETNDFSKVGFFDNKNLGLLKVPNNKVFPFFFQITSTTDSISKIELQNFDTLELLELAGAPAFCGRNSNIYYCEGGYVSVEQPEGKYYRYKITMTSSKTYYSDIFELVYEVSIPQNSIKTQNNFYFITQNDLYILTQNT